MNVYEVTEIDLSGISETPGLVILVFKRKCSFNIEHRYQLKSRNIGALELSQLDSYRCF